MGEGRGLSGVTKKGDKTVMNPRGRKVDVRPRSGDEGTDRRTVKEKSFALIFLRLQFFFFSCFLSGGR